MKISGIILAGGKSSRMGREKGLVEFEGKPMVHYPLELLSTITTDIVLVANDKGYAGITSKVVKDEFHEKGPLAGLITGLRNSEFDHSIVLPCDMPNIAPALIAWMLKQQPIESALVLKVGGRIHPLIGVYRKSQLPILEEMLSQNELRMMDVVSRIKARILSPEIEMEGFSEDWLRNYNSPSDFQRD